MQKVPLYFRIRQLVFGNGFAAGVEMTGRATAMEDFGAIWIYGVNPGGLAESGDDLASAYANFRAGLAAVLFHLAEEAEDFEGFRREAGDFLRATDEDSVAEWEAARKAIRGGDHPELNLILRIEPNDLEMEFRAEDLTKALESPSPHLNTLPDSTSAALAA